MVLANEQTYSIDHRIILPDKTIRYVHEQAEVYFDENNVPTRMTGTVQDITEQKITEERLQLSAKIFETSKDAIIITDHHANILEVNPSFTAITGYSRGGVLGKDVQILRSGKHPTEFYRQMMDELNQTSEWQGEDGIARKVPGKHTGMSNYVGIFSDLFVIKKSEEKINYLTNYDILTNLPKRILFRDLLQQNMHRLAEDNQCLAVIFLDIDHFKLINESLGIDAGDKLLCLVAERLNDCLSNKATLGRLGGDHFGIILDDLSNARHAATAAQKIINDFSQHFTLNNEKFFHRYLAGNHCLPR